MPDTRIWTLPDSLNDGFSDYLAGISRAVAGCIYYCKSPGGVLGMLNPAANLASEWVLPPEAAPAAAVALGNAQASASSLTLMPGRAPKIWCTLGDWNALGEFDPVLGQLRVFSSTATGPVNEGGAQPFATPRCVLPESETRIWFGARSYPGYFPLIGVLDTVSKRVASWTLGGPAEGCAIESLVIGADGRIWFGCSSMPREGEKTAFLGVLETRNRSVHYWLKTGISRIEPDRKVAVNSLGAHRPHAARHVWLVVRDRYSSILIRVDASTGAMLQYGLSELTDGPFNIGVLNTRSVAVGYRDFFRMYDNVNGCRNPIEFETMTQSVRADTADAQMNSAKVKTVKTKLQVRTVQTASVEETCATTLTPDAPGMCGFLRAESNGRIWLGREGGNEIGLYTP